MNDQAPSAELTGRFTDEAYWDEYWRERGGQLPAVIERDPRSFQVNAILDVFDTYASAEEGGVALEIGGSPGRYLAYLHRRFDCGCALLDISSYGCSLARKNFELLGIPGRVYEGDLLDPELDIGTFDLVYSLGLIEHFSDLEGVVAAHARLVSAGGTLVLGVPNLLGVNHWFMKRLGPQRLAVHNTEVMPLERWDAFESRFGLDRQFRGFVGGFDPGVFCYVEERTLARLPIRMVAEVLMRTFGTHWPRLRRFNHPKLSGYLMGVWRVPRPPLADHETGQHPAP
jgi:SAM-dependent methyltransferase